VRQLPVKANFPPFLPEALCPSNKPIPGQRPPVQPGQRPRVQKGLTICNKTSANNVYVAIALNYRGFFDSEGFGTHQYIESHGWWKIEPGDCKNVCSHDARRVSGYYAKGGDSVWRGSGSD